MNAAEAAPIVAQAFELEINRKPTVRELEGLLAVARGETHFGTSWPTEAGRAAHNWGAIHGPMNRDGTCPVGTFGSGDSHPTASGDKSYRACFRAYPDDVAGARDLIRLVCRDSACLAALGRGNAHAFCRAQYEARYYEGHGATKGERIENRTALIWGSILANAKERNVATSWVRGSSPPEARKREAKLRLATPLAGVLVAILKKGR